MVTGGFIYIYVYIYMVVYKCEGIEISWVEFVNLDIFFPEKSLGQGFFFRKTAREMAYHQHWLEGM